MRWHVFQDGKPRKIWAERCLAWVVMSLFLILKLQEQLSLTILLYSDE